MKVCTLLGDSLAMVRPLDGINYRETYCYKLSILLGGEFHVVSNARRANDLVRQAYPGYMEEEVLHHESDYVVVHLGIVDCSPRLFTRREQKILALAVPAALRKAIIRHKSRHRYFYTRRFPKRYVQPGRFQKEFEVLLNGIFKAKTTAKVLILNIADTNDVNKRRSFGFHESITRYNAILAEFASRDSERVRLIDMYARTVEDPALLLPDGIHITPACHTLIAQLIHQEIAAIEGR